MNARLAKRLRRSLIAIAHVAFACKLLIPVGYMPAALGAGGPVKLCPGSFPIGVPAGRAGHDRDGGHSDETEHEDASVWERCSLGALAATPVLPSSQIFDVPRPRPGSIAAPETAPARHARPIAFRARAPPRTLS